MFTNERYVTQGISLEIPEEIQLALWIKIDNLRRNNIIELDYLQVFKLSEHNGEQRIIHIQEQPEYHNDILIKFTCESVKKAKIFVIDDGNYTTMMLASEY